MTAEEMGRCLTKLKMVLTQWAPKEIDKDLATMWVGILKEYPDNEIRAAFAKAASNYTEWPAPATIKRLCQGSFKSDEEHGQEIAALIEGAISAIGSGQYYMRREDKDKHSARLLAKIGPIGMEVVKMTGGWEKLCRCDNDDLMSLRKQLRELGTIVSKNFHTTGANQAPGLPERRDPVLTSALKLVMG